MGENIFDPLRCVAVNRGFVDPAIDFEGSDFALYRVDRDRARLAIREGEQPFEFIVKRLPMEWAAILERGSSDLTDGERYQYAFRASCHRIERGGEVILEVRPEDLVDGQHGTKLAPVGWVKQVAYHMIDDTVGFGLSTVEEMGQVAYSTSRLPPRARAPFNLRASDATRR